LRGKCDAVGPDAAEELLFRRKRRGLAQQQESATSTKPVKI
jgi:hypothetical protein